MTSLSHIDQLRLAWFSGFVDGEGYFQLMGQKMRYQAWLNLVVREDDASAVEEIFQTLECGSVHPISKKGDRRQGKNSRDRVLWKSRKKDEVVQIIIPLFDLYPLRTKKQYEYLIWCEAALLIHQGANKSEKGRVFLRKYAEMLKEQRKFGNSKPIELPNSPSGLQNFF